LLMSRCCLAFCLISSALAKALPVMSIIARNMEMILFIPAYLTQSCARCLKLSIPQCDCHRADQRSSLSPCENERGESRREGLILYSKIMGFRNMRLLSLALLYLRFPLRLSLNEGLGRGSCPAACRRQDSGADELVTLWHWLLAKSARSLSHSSLCPKLEPLIERPSKSQLVLQE
jgi:hypothetical protein